ncbi:MAG: hypothetical protein R3E79_00065 [Caldilineaceae bacterium]
MPVGVLTSWVMTVARFDQKACGGAHEQIAADNVGFYPVALRPIALPRLTISDNAVS